MQQLLDPNFVYIPFRNQVKIKKRYTEVPTFQSLYKIDYLNSKLVSLVCVYLTHKRRKCSLTLQTDKIVPREITNVKFTLTRLLGATTKVQTLRCLLNLKYTDLGTELFE